MQNSYISEQILIDTLYFQNVSQLLVLNEMRTKETKFSVRKLDVTFKY